MNSGAVALSERGARGERFAAYRAGGIRGDGKRGRALAALTQDQHRHVGDDVDLVGLAQRAGNGREHGSGCDPLSARWLGRQAVGVEGQSKRR